MLPLWDDKLRQEAMDFAEVHRRYTDGELSESQIFDLQAPELAATLAYVQERSPFYAEHLRGFNVAGMSIGDLAELPFTTKQHLREELDRVPSLALNEAWVYYETTGTTGVSTPCPRAPQDSMRANMTLCESYGRILSRYGPRSTVAVLGPTELHSTGDTFGDVLRTLGHVTIKMWPHSPVVGFNRALQLIERLGVNVLVCTPGMAVSLARKLLDDSRAPHQLGVDAIFVLGELASPAFLANIGRVWSAEVYNCMYASQEASILATCSVGGELVSAPLNIRYEVIDPESALPAETTTDGCREGELVITHLYRGAKPLVRYRTGDMVRVRGGSQAFTMVPVGRLRDRVIIGDYTATALDFEQAVLEHAPAFLDFQTRLSDGPDGGELLEVVLEPLALAAEVDGLGALSSDELERALSRKLGLTVKVCWEKTDARASTGAMVSWKAARFLDERTTKSIEGEYAQRIARQRAGL